VGVFLEGAALKELWEVSFGILWGLVALEGVILRQVLQQTTGIMRKYAESPSHDHDQLPYGTPAPMFEGKLLGSNGTICISDLKGDNAILLFLSPEDKALPSYDDLTVGTHALWHKAHGRLYLICSGAERACRDLVQDRPADGFDLTRVPLVLDQDRLIAESFRISTTPQAVLLDNDLRISRYGHLLLSGEGADNAVQ
jgi:hypothetical protein